MASQGTVNDFVEGGQSHKIPNQVTFGEDEDPRTAPEGQFGDRSLEVVVGSDKRGEEILGGEKNRCVITWLRRLALLLSGRL